MAKIALVFLGFALAFSSCDPEKRVHRFGEDGESKKRRYFLKSKHDKLLMTNDIEKKFEGAKAYYNDEDYIRALPLLKQLQVMLSGTKTEEEVRYYIAFAHYGLQELTIASYLFKRMVLDFPKGQYTEDAQFMTAECLYVRSPRYYLDQVSTDEASRGFQLYLERYPNGKKKDLAETRIRDLRRRLEEKAFQNAQLYFHIEKYEAAIVSYRNILKEFPDTDKRESILFEIVRSNFKYAEKSILSKQIERYRAVIETAKEFKSAYPESKRMSDLETLEREANSKIDELKELNL